MSVQDWCSGEEAMVPAALRGYRMWNVSMEQGLCATSSGHGGWGADGTLVAECHRGLTFNVWQSQLPVPKELEHAAPAEGCGCGIYGWYRPDDTRLHHGAIFGVIEASGRVLLGDFGFRAERARIIALAIPGESWAMTRLREEWSAKGVAVFADRDALLAEFPPDDVTTLLGREIPDEPPAVATWAVGGSLTFTVTTQAMQDYMKAIQQAAARTNLAFVSFGYNDQLTPRRRARRTEPVEPQEQTPQERALALRRARNTGPQRRHPHERPRSTDR